MRLVANFINQVLFFQIPSKSFGHFKRILQIRRLRRKYKSCFTVYSLYPNALANLCDKYGSDKGSALPSGHLYNWRPHCYTEFYELVFRNIRMNVRTVFECGIGSSHPNLPANMGKNAKPGASLRVWREYFPNAKIYGADIDSSILFIEDRITTFQLNQLDSASIRNAFVHFDKESLDFILDDGLHTFEAAKTLFANTNYLLSQNGIYIIEDVTPDTLKRLSNESLFTDDFVLSPIVFHERKQIQELNSLLMITRNHYKT